MDFEKYKEEVLNECKKLGASTDELTFITDEIIKTGMSNNRSPQDFAWALLQ